MRRGFLFLFFSCIVKYMKEFVVGFGGAILVGGVAAVFLLPSITSFIGSRAFSSVGISRLEQTSEEPRQKTPEELFREAFERSRNIKGLYMTADVANDFGAGAVSLRDQLIETAKTTEINGFVIDVKETCGADYNERRIRELIDTLHQNDIWAIARIVVFKDASQRNVHPEWYLTRDAPIPVKNECWRKEHLTAEASDGGAPDTIFWRDRRGGYWLDPAHPEARRYIADFSKKMIDLGFDELQFDYVRFPSDGDVENAIYPVWDGATPKYLVMKSFFEFLNRELKKYKPNIILSADLFGYAAVLHGDVGIGQRLEDIGNSFDYISFMLYPSHYYTGFRLPADPARDLPAVDFNLSQSRANPDIIVGRSLLVARDFLDGRIGTTTLVASVATSTSPASTTPSVPRSRARLRPWLEDFYHEADAAAGRPSGAEKVRLQIDAAEHAEGSGWLLWNAANIYTEAALKKR